MKLKAWKRWPDFASESVMTGLASQTVLPRTKSGRFRRRSRRRGRGSRWAGLAEAGLVVFDAVARRGVDEARAVFEGDVFGGDHAVEGKTLSPLPRVGGGRRRALPRPSRAGGGRDGQPRAVDEGVAVTQADESVAGGCREDSMSSALPIFVTGPTSSLAMIVMLPSRRTSRVLNFRHRDGEVRGERPGRGRPDHERGALRGARGARRRPRRPTTRKAERVVDGVGVGLPRNRRRSRVSRSWCSSSASASRGLVRDRPVHGLQLAEDEPLLDERGEEFDGRAPRRRATW